MMLELKNISFEVEAEKDTKGILKDISLKLDDNKFIAITGPNGGGKSTLAKVIAGSKNPLPAAYCWTGRTSRILESHSGQSSASAMPFSSRCALRA